MSTMIWIAISYACMGAVFASMALCYVMRDKQRNATSRRSGRSRCDHCGAVLHWYELIPIVSWCVQRGACNHCHRLLSRHYLWSELSALILFGVMAYVIAPVSWSDALLWYGMIACAYGISLYDIYHQELDVKIYIIWLGLVAVYYSVFSVYAREYWSIVQSSLLRGLLWLLIRGYGMVLQKRKSGLRKQGFGFGDVLVGALLGGMIPMIRSRMEIATVPGTEDISTIVRSIMVLMVELFVSSALGIIVYSIIRSTGRARDESAAIPFLPFMVVGYIISLIIVICYGGWFAF